MRPRPLRGWRAEALRAAPMRLRAAPLALLAAVLALLLASGATLRSSQAEAGAPAGAGSADDPAAPLPFSHATHVAEVGLDCQFCHAYARRSPVAGMPPLARCAGCHRFVRPDSPHVARLLQRFEAGAPLAWPRVHDLPDHVRFTHQRHVSAGVACSTCHGDVARMQVAEQTTPLSMDWCVSCHEARQAPLDCLTCHY